MSKGLTAAEVWRNKARARRAAVAVPTTLPSGAEVKLARPPIESWFGTDRLPQSLSEDIVRVFGGEQTEQAFTKAIEDLGEQRAGQVVNFLNRIVQESVLEPRVVLGEPTSPDEMPMADIPDEDKAFIMLTMLRGFDKQPVSTKRGGEIPVEDLKTFPAERGVPAAG